MKSFLIFGGAIAVMVASFTARGSASQTACGHAIVRTDVEVADEEVFLSDLLESGASSALRQAASRIRLGDTPLTGTTRVLEGREIRVRLDSLSEESKSRCRSWSVPERISVRRAGDRASCADLVERIRPLLAVPVAALAAGDAGCGAAGRIPQDASLEIIGTAWNPSLSTWDIHARCTHIVDCVPFFVRLRDSEAGRLSDISDHQHGSSLRPIGNHFPMGQSAPAARANPAVHPGQTLTLVWDGNGIRVSVPALCLDPGEPGQQVRARIIGGGIVVRAVVVDAASLRAIS